MEPTLVATLSAHPAVDEILQGFCAVSEQMGLQRIPAQSPWSASFADGANRLLEHQLITSDMARSTASLGWYELGPVIRLKDMRRVAYGRHLTAFEMLAALRYAAPTEGASAKAMVARAFMSFVRDVGLDPTRLYAGYFAGGEVLPGLRLEPDRSWPAAWIGAGLATGQLMPTCGPAAFTLLVGDGERCGPISEVFYRTDRGNLEEIGTIIGHDSLMRLDSSGQFRLCQPQRGAYGFACGLERLLLVVEGREQLSQTSLFAPLFERVCQAIRQPEGTAKMLEADAMAVVDVARTLVIFSRMQTDSANQVVRQTVDSLYRRLIRKLTMIQADDSRDVLQSIEQMIVSDLRLRYTVSRSNGCSLADCASTMNWAHAWNPDALKRAKLR